MADDTNITNNTDYDVIIIGAGHNGLVTAGYLAKAGRRVLVLERRDQVGGAAVTEEVFPGFRFSTCADGSGYSPSGAIPRKLRRRSRASRAPTPSAIRPSSNSPGRSPPSSAGSLA
ncbi:MAG: NAD(P)/FAD-dependent oxidoreductase [Deltaproteobacteria bacterium]|nr:NAD(P)/FAD-dependent oxidoreductase [Deltaproteobacteria bacterium]